MRRLIGLLVTGAVAGTLVLVGVTGGGGGGAGDTANLFAVTSDGTARCTRQVVPTTFANAAASAKCSNWNAAWQAARGGDVVEVQPCSYGTQSFATRSAGTMTCGERVTSGGVTFRIKTGVSVGFLRFGSEPTWGFNGTQIVDCIKVAGEPWTVSNLYLGNADDIVVSDFTCNRAFAASVKCAQWYGRTNRTMIDNAELCCVTDDKVMEASISDGAAHADTTVEDNSDIVIEDSAIHGTRRTAEDVHNECFMAAGTPGLVLRRTHWHGCTVMNINVGGFGHATDVPVENFHWVNNIFEAPTAFTENDKGAAPFFQGCNTPAPTTKPGWVVEYNAMETGWYLNDVCTADNGLLLRANVGQIGNCLSGETQEHNIWELDCGGTNAQNATLLSASNFTNIAAHDWTYTATAFQIDKGDPANYPRTDFAGASRFLGVAPDAGPYEKR